MKESKIFINQNLSEKVHYVYRVTIDEKYYIGKRTGFLNDLETGRYKTSSKLVQEKLKNGKTFSKIKIIQVFYTSEEALKFEERILTRVNAKRNPKFLNQTNGGGENFCLKQHTEKSKKKMSNKGKERFNPETEEGRKNLENVSKKAKERFNPETEEGRINLEKRAQISKAQFDPNTESGRRNLEKQSQISLALFDKNTEEGRKRCESLSKSQIEYFNPETELGRKRRKHMSNKRKEKAKEHLQNRKDASILGDLIFDEDFIRQNFLILDNKNNQRFLSSVYSKLSGYSRSHIKVHKRNGKLSFLSGITSINLSEKDENAKIKEIEQLLKSKNEKE